jgi:hypothetical protein
MTDHTPEQQAAERFRLETSGHRLTVLQDNGLYRHLRFENPRHGSLYRADLITWPHGLAVRGDGPNFTFSLHPTRDLFEMFRGSSQFGINPGYWKEKVQAGEVLAWSEVKFRDWLIKAARGAEALHRGIGAAVREKILDSDEYDLAHEEMARAAVADFDHNGHHLRYPARWEWSFEDWSWEYLWGCHAIVRIIAEYDQFTAGASVRATRYTVNAVPDGALSDPYLWDIHVERLRDGKRWFITNGYAYLDARGVWHHTLHEAGTHGFEEAMTLARAEAPRLQVMGRTAAEAVTWAAQRSALEA